MTDGELLERLRASADPGRGAAPDPERPTAAVLILADPETPGVPLLFIQRSADLRLHAGQIGFPGGSSERDDADAAATALREAAEEVGFDPENAVVLGTLPPLMTAVSNLWLTPVIALQRAAWTPRGDGHEVAEIFHVGLDRLLGTPPRTERWVRDGISRDVHFFEIEGRTIWGVTGAIVAELVRRITGAGVPESPPPAR